MKASEHILQYLPSRFYFSPATEKEFQHQLNRNSLRLATIVLYLTIFFLCTLSIQSVVAEGITENIVVNILRVTMIALSIALISNCKNEEKEQLHHRFFAYAIMFCCLFNYLFWTFSQTHNELHEGGPMLLAAGFVSIPMLHLGHKLILWFVIGVNLLAIHLFTSVSILWTLYFYFGMAMVMASIQYQLDVLLRTQFKGKLIEAEKARTDQLTGIYNRRSFDSKCVDLITRLKPSQHIALAMIDIDYFKKYNDNYGHLEGDTVLVQVADLLSDCGADLVVRFGGEEFILVKILDDNTVDWLKDLPATFATKNISHEYSPFNHVTVSIGLALANHSENPVTTKTLLTIADAEMYKAKSAGRNQVFTANV